MSNQAPYRQAAPEEPQIASPVKKPVFTPKITYILIGFTVLVYLGQCISQFTQGVDLLANFGAKINQAIIAGQLWRLVTPIFLHASPIYLQTSLLHIGFNMYALFILGPSLERYYGRARFLLLYFVSGIAGNVVSFYFSPYDSLGASTSIFGLVAAEAVFVYRNRDLFGKQAGSILRNLFIIVAINLAIGLAPGIDNWGHIGGLLGGLAFAWTSGPLFVVNWLPGGAGYRVDDQNLNSRMWLYAAVEVAVLVGLVFLKIINS